MGCLWCKSNRTSTVRVNATNSINDFLLSSSEERIVSVPHTDLNGDQSTKCGENNNESIDTLKPPLLIPDIRSLQYLIFWQIHDEFGTYLFPKKQSLFGEFLNIGRNLEKQQFYVDIMSISLSIAMLTNGPNNAYTSNMHKLLGYSIQSNHGFILLPDLVGLIISFLPTISFCSDIEEEEYRDQLTFSPNETKVIFDQKDEGIDYLNIRSKHLLVGPKMVINCYVHGKGDEMWIGLVNRNTYTIFGEIEREHGSLLYYGARESRIGSNRPLYSEWDTGTGAIHGFGKVMQQIPPFRAGDWISFRIDMDSESPKCEVFKNYKQVASIDALPFDSKSNSNSKFKENESGDEMECSDKEESEKKRKTKNESDSDNDSDGEIENENGIYFCVVVDDRDDAILVEEVMMA